MERARTEKIDAKAGQPVLARGAKIPGAAPAVIQSLRLGSFTLRLYSVFFVASIALGYFLSVHRAKKTGFNVALFEDICFWLIINSFLAARAYYVIFYFDQYRGNLAEIFKIWHGGLAIYGALIGGILTLLYFARKHKIPFLQLADLAAYGLPLAQALGRFGNYFNYEAFGGPTNLPWKMFVPLQFRPPGYEQFQYFHPAFLYESLWDVLVFIVLVYLARKNPRTGMIAAAYLIFYSIGRYYIEGIRLDSAFFFHGLIRGDQLTAIFMLLLGLAIMIKTHAPQNA